MACISRLTAVFIAPTTAITPFANARRRARCCSRSAFPASLRNTSAATRSIAARTPRSLRPATFTSPTVTATRGCTSTTPDGKHLMSWGEPGTDPGQFNLVHNICCDRRRLGVRRRPRKSSRPGLRWLGALSGAVEQLASTLRPVHGQRGRSALLHRRARADARLEPALSESRAASEHHHQHRRGARTHQPSPHAGLGAGEFVAPHGLAVDSRGDVYIGEVSYTAWNAVFPERPKPAHIRTLAEVRARLLKPGVSKPQIRPR